jgi:superfamily II DNA/RNA helicase
LISASGRADEDIVLSFENLKLDPKLLRAVAACHFNEPTDIQRQAIPVALEGRDLMASAQTGTGKTAAFVLPLLQRLLKPSAVKGRGPRVLVLTPTRELAMQIADNVRQFSRECRVTSGLVVGGVGYGGQLKLLQQPLDILVATPGRLMDHMEQRRVDFSRIETLVLDEADRMLDMGFVDAVKKIAAATPATRQTLLFSATLEGAILDIARRLLKDPARIQLAGNKEQHASIAQQLHEVDDIAHKHSLLDHILRDDGLYQAVIFTATKRSADKLAKTLADRGHASAALHGDMNQSQRKRTVDRMRRGDFRLLVATDVAARGLDIKGISHVINFDLPMVAEDYIHRIGRTGRAGASGIAISFVDAEDRRLLAGIERLTGRRLERRVIEGLEPRRRLAANDRGAPQGPRRHGKPNHGHSHGQPARGGRDEGGARGASGKPPRNGSQDRRHAGGQRSERRPEGRRPGRERAQLG